MKKVPTKQHDELVRTTVRLPRQTYQRLRTLSVEEGKPMQRILDQAVTQYERQMTERQTKALVKKIFKHTAKGLKGKLDRASIYEEYFDRKFGPRH